MDKISLIIPCYNAEKTLLRTLNSVREQDYKELEIIVVDDGSTDNSVSVLQKYAQIDSRFKIVNSEHVGAAHAKNLGLKNCTGKYVLFLNADNNYTTPYAISTMYKAIKRGFDADMCVCNFDSSCFDSFYADKSFNLNRAQDLLTFFQTDRTVVWNKMIKRTAITIPFDESLNDYADALFNYQNLKNLKKVVSVSNSLVNYTCHGNKHAQDFNIFEIASGNFGNAAKTAFAQLKLKFENKLAKPKNDLAQDLWAYFVENLFFVCYQIMQSTQVAESKKIEFCKTNLSNAVLTDVLNKKNGIKFLGADEKKLNLFVKLADYAFNEIKTFNKNISTHLVAKFVFAKIFFEPIDKLDATDILTQIFLNNKLPEVSYTLNLFELNNLGLI